jgi:hypothetical protein
LVGSDHEADHVPHAEYDKEDPPMAVGSTYPSIEEFKYLSMLSNMSLNTKLTIVHHIGLGAIVQEKSKITVRGGYMLL